jgi:hypothetical protein
MIRSQLHHPLMRLAWRLEVRQLGQAGVKR